MKTIIEIIDILSPFQILVQSSNYLQFIDCDNKFREVQKDYKVNKWYEFKSFGSSLIPGEKFIKFID